MGAGEEMETESPEIEIVDVEKDAKASAENQKEEGNQLYKAKKYQEAIAKYSCAIELCPENPAYYGNRAACQMMLYQYNKALEDAKTSVQLDTNFVKGSESPYYRVGQGIGYEPVKPARKAKLAQQFKYVA